MCLTSPLELLQTLVWSERKETVSTGFTSLGSHGYVKKMGRMEIDGFHNQHMTAIWRLYCCHDLIYFIGQNSKFPVQGVIESKYCLGTKLIMFQVRQQFVYNKELHMPTIKIYPINSNRIRPQNLHGLFYFPARSVKHLQCIWVYTGKVLKTS